jgi:hypothetical protein
MEIRAAQLLRRHGRIERRNQRGFRADVERDIRLVGSNRDCTPGHSIGRLRNICRGRRAAGCTF